MKIKVLSSGSHGNCYILETGKDTLIIEAGIQYHKILKGLEFDLSKVVGCLVSHEHKDHSKSAACLARAGVDVYSLESTASAIGLMGHRAINVEQLKQFEVGDFKVMPFPIEHDVEGLGFLIEHQPTGERLLFLTDSYYSKYKFKNINYLLIECNYIKETLDKNIEHGYISEASKARLLRSHMSLENLKKFLKANDLSQCQEILLLHLSSRNSDSKRMIEDIKELTGIKPKIAREGLEVELSRFPY